MSQLEFDLELDPITKFSIDIECLKKNQDSLRKSFFSRLNGMEKILLEQNEIIEKLKRELEAAKILSIIS